MSPARAPSVSIRPPRSWSDPASHWSAAMEHPWYRQVIAVQHQVQMAVHEYMNERGIVMAALPATTGSISSPMGLGSDSLPVQVELHGVRTHLVDSMQFFLELACRIHPHGVYYIMPCFRGEDTDPRHLSEFYHAEVEIPGRLDDVISLTEGLLGAVAQRVANRCEPEILSTAGTTSHIRQLLDAGGLPRVPMADAVQMLTAEAGPWVRMHSAGFPMLTADGEAELVRRCGNGLAVWVCGFHHLAVPFYQAREPGGDSTMTADLLLGGRETVGSGQRHRAAADVLRALEEHDVSSRPYEWYVSMRRLRPMQTSGMGMGVERLLMWLMQHDDIRDFQLLVRRPGVEVIP